MAGGAPAGGGCPPWRRAMRQELCSIASAWGPARLFARPTAWLRSAARPASSPRRLWRERDSSGLPFAGSPTSWWPRLRGPVLLSSPGSLRRIAFRSAPLAASLHLRTVRHAFACHLPAATEAIVRHHLGKCTAMNRFSFRQFCRTLAISTH